MLGRRYDAETMERWGLVNKVVPDEQLDAATMVLAQELAHGPTVCHTATKQAGIGRGGRTASRRRTRLWPRSSVRSSVPRTSAPASTPIVKMASAWRASRGVEPCHCR